MRRPSPKKSNTVVQGVLQDLPEESEALAVKTGAFRRGRKVKSASELLHMVLLYGGLDYTLKEVTALFILLYRQISERSMQERLAGCTEWLESLMGKMLQVEERATLLQWGRVLLLDATNLNARAGKGTAYRLHVCLELLTQRVVQIEVSDKHTGESLRNFDFCRGDVVVADRAYCRINGLFDALSLCEIDVVLRYPSSLKLFERQSLRPIELAQRLRQQPFETIQSLPVRLVPPSGHKSHGPIDAWLHCYRLSQSQAEEARRKRKKRDQHKRGSTPKQDTLFLCGFFIVLTNVSPQQLSAQSVLKLYRARWQIELAFKRLKSLLDLDRYRASAGSDLGKVWLYAKLLYALLIERRLRRLFGDHWLLFDSPRRTSLWRPFKLIKAQLQGLLLDVPSWAEEAWLKAFEALCERPRKKRHLQRLPKEVFEYRRIVPKEPSRKVA